MKTKLLAANQLVGTSPNWAVFRNLFEFENGERISVPTSKEFDITLERKLGKQYPSQEILFEKHKLPEWGA